MYCSKCGTELPEDAAFCRNCGIPLSKDNNAQKKNKTKLGLVLLTSVLMVVILVGALMYGVFDASELGNTQTTSANVFRFLW